MRKKIFRIDSSVPDKEVMDALKLFMDGKEIVDIIKHPFAENGFRTWLVKYKD